ncbi:anthranilate synthase component 1 [Methanomicrobium sp. W14]|uniref:anthranilate synthase component I family protein n=1 Tax=Methanomicrobium sp. W14 TaxID=2817839 RepID=UPI001AE7A5FF|nr:anthranilate synthase component I family protein [Methanomicrobium sp. W14]MBP2132428.1 anthranilate synthase component 1 [Methanomicrobium sp. W14]
MYIYVQNATSIVYYDNYYKKTDGDAGGMETGIDHKRCSYAKPSFEKFRTIKKNLKENSLVPVYRTIKDPGTDPASAYEAVREKYGFLLESIEGTHKNAGYSVIGTGVLLHITAGPEIKMTGEFNPADKFEGSKLCADSIYGILKSFEYEVPDIPGYSGGFTGYFSYDFALKANDIPVNPDTQAGFPLAEFMMPKVFVIFDHIRKNLTFLTFVTGDGKKDPDPEYEKAVAVIESTEKKILGAALGLSKKENENGLLGGGGQKKITYSSDVSEKQYEEMVRKAREYILDGDIFQVVVSRGCECDFPGDPYLIYRQMRRINPSPYMYFMDFSERQVVGASPEMLVRVKGRNISSVPIAGTRKRGRTEEEDIQLEKDLVTDKKERAEHLMLVDLSRNDIGRVSKYGSVRVTDFMSVEKFSHVQHMVSTVEGVLLDKKNSIDAFMSCFPAGTVSGAPKIRAMQIIEELEHKRRGLYAGAAGYIGLNENIDFAITIRTVVVKDKKAYFQSGAGIVAGSVPESEFQEAENKAASMRSAIESAGDLL